MARSFVDHRWDSPRKLGFAPDSPLEQAGFELSVPPERKAFPRALDRFRSPGTASLASRARRAIFRIPGPSATRASGGVPLCFSATFEISREDRIGRSGRPK